jgi:ABC-2 type transport system permease protein
VVGLFVRLKLRLVAGSLRHPARAALVVVGSLLGLAGVGLVGAALVVFRDEPATVAATGVLVATVLALGWATIPIAAFGVDETLDVSRLALLPLTRGRLLAGLLAGALLGVPPLLTVLLVGVTVGATVTSAVAVPVAGLAGVLLVAMCLLLGRVTTSGLSRLLRSRRGRDLAVLVGLLIVVAAQLPRLLLADVDERRLVSIGGVLRWFPPGAAVRAVADASAGRWGPALLSLAAAAAFVGLLLAAWYVALGAALTVVDASTAPAGRRAGFRGGRLAAVAQKELRYAWRDPRLKFGWLQMMLFGVGVPAFSLWGEGRFLPLLAAVFSALLLAAQQFNVLGPEGSAFWLTAVATATERDARTDLAGRNLAVAAVGLAWAVVASVVLAVLAGSGVASVPAAVGAAAAVLGAGLGVGVVISVLGAYPVPDQAAAAFAGPGAGRGCLAGLLWTVGVLATGVLAAPVVGPALASGSWPVALAVAVGGPAWGGLLAWVGRRLAAAHLVTHLPELLVAVTPDRT